MNTTLELTPPTQTVQLSHPAPEVDVDKLDTAMPLAVVFQPFQTTLEKWQAKVASLLVTDLSQKTEMAQARLARLELKDARVNMDKTRKSLVENLKARTGKIDATARIIREKIEQLEATLLESEQFAERHAAKIKAQLKIDREMELGPWMDAPIIGDLSDLSEKDFTNTLNNAKLLRQTKLEAAAKAESERKAREESERLERERIAAENVRLKAEAVEKERLAEIERKRIEAERAEQVRQRNAENQRLKAERDEQLRKAKEESDRQAEVSRVAHLKAMAEAKAEADRKAAAALKEKKRIELEAQRLKAELDEQARLAAAQEAERQAALRALAAAPDKAKIEFFVAALNALPLPELANWSFTADIKTIIERASQRISEMIPRL